MHELSRAKKIVDELSQMNINEVVKIEIAHPKQSFIMLEEVRECFALLTENTDYQGSEILFIAHDHRLICRNCDYRYILDLEETKLKCPECFSKKISLMSSNELMIMNVESLAKEV